MTTYELDELQSYLQDPETIENTKQFLISLDINEKYVKLYLTSFLFKKIPEFFDVFKQ